MREPSRLIRVSRLGCLSLFTAGFAIAVLIAAILAHNWRIIQINIGPPFTTAIPTPQPAQTGIFIIPFTPTPSTSLPAATLNSLTYTSTASQLLIIAVTGTLGITYPMEMKLNESDVVVVEIVPKPNITHTSQMSGRNSLFIIRSRSGNGLRDEYESEIEMLPVMRAELLTTNFTVTNMTNDERRFIDSDRSTGWVWNIAPLKPGLNVITINIYGRELQNRRDDEQLTKSVSLDVHVIDKPFLEKVSDILVNNIVTVLGTSGLLGVILGLIPIIRNRRSNREITRLHSYISKLESDNKAISNELDKLKKRMQEEERINRLFR